MPKTQKEPVPSLLDGATVYLSGPMDFVASRQEEMKNGWRARITGILENYGVRVFDPWYKPEVKGLGRYGLEDATTPSARERWTFKSGPKGAAIRSALAAEFWPVMHIDLRMVDLSDFIIACTPTNLYSVGTPHEVVLARQQRKPVLMVCPPVRYPKFAELKDRLEVIDAEQEVTRDEDSLAALLEDVRREVVARDNPKGTPSQWYMPLVDSESFFDGFGWDAFRARHGAKWPVNYLDERETDPRPARALLPLLEKLARGSVPRRWNRHTGKRQVNDDWLLLAEVAKERH